MDDQPLVSIVVPVYNHERYVGATLRSLMAQTYRNLELVVVDDGSRDNSVDVIDELAADCRHRFKRYIQIEQPNLGASVASNRGIDAAHGDFLFSIASDDVAEPDAIETLMPEMLRDPQVGLACGDADFIDADGAPIQMTGRDGRRFSSFVRFYIDAKTDFDLAADFGTYRSFIDYNYIPIGLLIRRSYFSQIGCFDPTFALEDWAAWLSLSKICRFKFVDRVLGHYRFHGENSVTRAQARHRADLVRLMLREAPYCHAHGLEGQWQRFAERSFERYRKYCEDEIDRLRKLLEETQRPAAQAAAAANSTPPARIEPAGRRGE
ncbi:MAG: glycosyltransferase [Bradyrhizobium sp.]